MGGGGGGGGGGGRPSDYSGTPSPITSKVDEVEKKIIEKSDLTNLQNQKEDIKKFVKKEIEKSSNILPWDHNDHSFLHVERVIKKLPNLIKNLEDISFSKEFIKDKLSDLDKEILKYSIILHDIGRCKPNSKNHALASKEYIEQLNRNINPSILKDIALLAQLHTPSGIKSLGGKSLTDLINKGILNKRQAYLASILTITDALDAGKSRIQHNSQKKSAKDVIEKIKSVYSKSLASSKLEHWYGHDGFSNTKLIKEDSYLKLGINLDTKLSEKHSASIAFRVFDIIKDITTSYLPNSGKFKFGIKIFSKNTEKAKQWHDDNKLIFESEKKISSIEFNKLKE